MENRISQFKQCIDYFYMLAQHSLLHLPLGKLRALYNKTVLKSMPLEAL